MELSIVVPVYRESASINGALAHIASRIGRRSCEVIVADGDRGSTIEAVEGDYPFPVVPLVCPAGRGTQMNAGAGLAVGQALLFLHVDTRLPPRAADLVLCAIERHQAGAFSIRAATEHPVIELIMRLSSLRSRLTRLPYGDQAQFFRREFFQRIGGYRPLPLMEDVEIMLRLRARGTSIRILPQKVYTSDRRWRSEGIARATLRNWWVYARYRAGTPAEELVRFYRPPNSSGRCSGFDLRSAAP
jgi:rSAM/selenodomain-associated transferase 2